MDFPDFDNIISLLHNQSRMLLWNTGKRGENQSTNHLVDLLKPSSTKFELEGSKNISLGYYLPYEQFVHRKKRISFTEAIDVLTNLREEIVMFESEGSVEEIQIPLQPVGKQANSAKPTVKQKKAIKGQQLLKGRKRRRVENFGYTENRSRSRMKSPFRNLIHRNEEGREQVGESEGVNG